MRVVVAVGLVGALLACTGASTPAPSPEPSAEAPEAGGKAGKRKGGKGGKAGDGPVIAKLASPHVDGCGCGLRQGEDTVFESDIDGVAWFNVDGSDVAFKQTSTGGTSSKVGDTFESTYSAEAQGLQAKIRWTVTRTCAPEDEGCESESYDTKIVVERAGQSSSVAASGACGC